MKMNSDDSEIIPCKKNKSAKGKRKSLVPIYVEKLLKKTYSEIEKGKTQVDEDSRESDLEIKEDTESTQLQTVVDIKNVDKETNSEVEVVEEVSSSEFSHKNIDEPILIDHYDDSSDEDIDLKNFSTEVVVSSTDDSSDDLTDQSTYMLPSSNKQFKEPCFIDLENTNKQVSLNDESESSEGTIYDLDHPEHGFLKTCKFCCQELETLKDPSGWLSDVIINSYLNLVVNGRTNWIALDSYIIEDIRIRKKRNFKRRRPLLPPCWMETPDMLIPVFAESHWSLLHVQIHKSKLRIYNSLISSSSDDEAVDVIADYLASEYFLACGKQIVWNRSNEMFPVQDNLNDCGVFVCMFARIAVQKLSKNIDPSIAKSFRSVIRSELIQNKLC